MNLQENLALAQAIAADAYQLLSRVMVAVEQRMQSESFTAVGDSSVFMDASTSLERGSRWLPKHLSRAYVKGKKPTSAVGYCIHLGPYTEPTTLGFLEKSHLTLPFISLACLRNMQPSPIEVDRRQLWDRLWDSGWWATYEDQVEGPLRTYTTTREISGFQAIITGALTTLCPLEPTDALVNRIVEPLLQLFADDKPSLQQSLHLIKHD
jgi:hypothetical protein